MAGALGLWAGALRSETVDRVLASIGQVAITQRDVEEEYHFEQFLQGQPPAGAPDAPERKAVLGRLISQELLAEQVGNLSTSAKSRAAAQKTLQEVRKAFPNEQAYRSALSQLGMTESQVLVRLERSQRTLRFIDDRLRPNAWPEPREVESYYKDTFVPEYAKGQSTPPPPLAKVQDKIQEILAEKKINQLLVQWLERLKSSNRVSIHSE